MTFINTLYVLMTLTMSVTLPVLSHHRLMVRSEYLKRICNVYVDATAKLLSWRS
jgi:hypothetical protein